MLLINVTFDSGLTDYIVKLDDAVELGVQEGAAAIVALARQKVRKDTHSLEETIDADKVPSGPGIHEYSVNAGNVEGGYKGGGHGESGRAAGSPVDYAIDQEYGLNGPGTPYMTPASEEGWPLVQEAVATQIEAIG